MNQIKIGIPDFLFLRESNDDSNNEPEKNIIDWYEKMNYMLYEHAREASNKRRYIVDKERLKNYIRLLKYNITTQLEKISEDTKYYPNTVDIFNLEHILFCLFYGIDVKSPSTIHEDVQLIPNLDRIGGLRILNQETLHFAMEETIKRILVPKIIKNEKHVYIYINYNYTRPDTSSATIYGLMYAHYIVKYSRGKIIPKIIRDLPELKELAEYRLEHGEIADIIIFEDVSYSGAQVINRIAGLKKYLKTDNIRIHTVFSFILSDTINTVLDKVNNLFIYTYSVIHHFPIAYYGDRNTRNYKYNTYYENIIKYLTTSKNIFSVYNLKLEQYVSTIEYFLGVIDKLPVYMQIGLYHSITPFLTIHNNMTVLDNNGTHLFPFQLHANLTILQYKIPAQMSCNHLLLSGTIVTNLYKRILESQVTNIVSFKENWERKKEDMQKSVLYSEPYLFLQMNSNIYTPEFNYHVVGNISERGRLIWYKTNFSIETEKRKTYDYIQKNSFEETFQSKQYLPPNEVSKIISSYFQNILDRSKELLSGFYHLDIKINDLYLVASDTIVSIHPHNLHYSIVSLFYEIHDYLIQLHDLNSDFDKFILLINCPSNLFTIEKFVSLMFWNVLGEILKKPIYVLFLKNGVLYPVTDDGVFNKTCFIYIRLQRNDTFSFDHVVQDSPDDKIFYLNMMFSSTGEPIIQRQPNIVHFYMNPKFYKFVSSFGTSSNKLVLENLIFDYSFLEMKNLILKRENKIHWGFRNISLS